MADTIFALSSGPVPAGIAVVRISGQRAGPALQALAGSLPATRRAVGRNLQNPSGDLLDKALVLWLPGPHTVTGEDVAELHLHGGRAVVTAVLECLGNFPGLRPAGAGEFTRRAFQNGRIDLAEAEGLADLLAAETELQRKAAMAFAGGGLSRQVEEWRDRVLAFSATVEAILDFSDDDDVTPLPPTFQAGVTALTAEMSAWLKRPRAEALRDGFRVVLAGPPNAGKSTLFNALVEEEAAITAPTAGTTRDVLTKAVAISGVPFVFADTAGLRSDWTDAVEGIGVDRARGAVANADIVLWLGSSEECPEGAWDIAAKSDLDDWAAKPAAPHRVSAQTGDGLDGLRAALLAHAATLMPKPGEGALNRRQHDLIARAADALVDIAGLDDLLLIAECLRSARAAFDALVGRATTEAMLDALFGRFCIGK